MNDTTPKSNLPISETTTARFGWFWRTYLQHPEPSFRGPPHLTCHFPVHLVISHQIILLVLCYSATLFTYYHIMSFYISIEDTYT